MTTKDKQKRQINKELDINKTERQADKVLKSDRKQTVNKAKWRNKRQAKKVNEKED